jgi:hypothetical protein
MHSVGVTTREIEMWRVCEAFYQDKGLCDDDLEMWNVEAVLVPYAPTYGGVATAMIV